MELGGAGVEVEMSCVEVDGARWSWMEVDGARWSWVEVDRAGWSWVHGLVILKDFPLLYDKAAKGYKEKDAGKAATRGVLCKKVFLEI